VYIIVLPFIHSLLNQSSILPTNEKKQNRYYRPTNLFLIITGTVELDTLLSVLTKYDSCYASSHPNLARDSKLYARPWTTPVSPLPDTTQGPRWEREWMTTTNWNDAIEEKEEEEVVEEPNEEEEGGGGATAAASDDDGDSTSGDGGGEMVSLSLDVGVKEVKIEFPSEDESCGTVVLGWRTEEYGDDLFQQMTQLDILMRWDFFFLKLLLLVFLYINKWICIYNTYILH
jgi:hypothetical protein